MPAFTVNSYGKGKAYYQCFRDTGEFWENMAEKILDELGIKSTLQGDLPKGVCAHKRECEDTEYLFVQNYSALSAKVCVGEGYVDMESGKAVDKVLLDAYDVKILKK